MAEKQHILVVEDETDICELLQYVLEREGFDVTCVANGQQALDASRANPFTLAVLDIMLPGMDGLTLCRKLREDPVTRAMPVVMLTARSEESDVVVGLEVGADDYLSKPFSPKELVARIRAVLRRVNDRTVIPADREPVVLKPRTPAAGGVVNLGPVTIDTERHTVKLRQQAVQLTLAEFKLLSLLMSRPGRVFSRDQILEQISGSDVYVIDRNVDVHVRAIRKKFGDDADFIETVRGVGYKCREA
ncbi:MAG: DNA-binding response regulator [Microbacteriaceae bacterium]|nr:DNA-binding response regulator [Microbacteriaceae bacterium]